MEVVGLRLLEQHGFQLAWGQAKLEQLGFRQLAEFLHFVRNLEMVFDVSIEVALLRK